MIFYGKDHLAKAHRVVIMETTTLGEYMYYLKSFYSLLYSAILVSIFASMVIILSLIPYLNRHAYLPAFWWAKAMRFFGGVKLNVQGLEDVDFSRPTMVVMNHRSHFDIVALMSATTQPLSFIAKKELRRIPFMGYGMHRVGMIFIDRSNREKARASLTVAAKQIQDGRIVVMFPEGTRSSDVKLQNFKKGAFFLAKEAEAYILPVVVLGSERSLPKNSLAIKASTITVRFGDTIKASKEQPVEELLNLTRIEMERQIALGE